MATLDTVVGWMDNGHFERPSVEDLDKLFAAVKAQKYAMYHGTYRQYMLFGGSHKEYFDSQCLNIARQTMAELLRRTRRPTILYHEPSVKTPLYLDVAEAMTTWEREIAHRVNYQYEFPHSFTYNVCMRCGRQESLPFIQIYHPKDANLKSAALIFDTTEARVLDMCQRSIKATRGFSPVYGTVASLCKGCHKACPCGATLGPRPASLDELTSFMLDNLCLDCASNLISKLSLPKLNSKELRMLRSNFNILRKEVIK